MSALSPETLTLASIVSVKIQSCLTKYEDEVNRRKKWVAAVRLHCSSTECAMARSLSFGRLDALYMLAATSCAGTLLSLSSCARMAVSCGRSSGASLNSTSSTRCAAWMALGAAVAKSTL